jgi:hypothetical protein
MWPTAVSSVLLYTLARLLSYAMQHLVLWARAAYDAHSNCMCARTGEERAT